MKGSRYSDDFKADAVKRFLEMKAEGKKIHQIEKELGVTNSALYSWTATAKEESKRATTATMLPATTPAAKSPEKTERGQFPREVREQALQLLDSGMTVTQVARHMKVGAATVGYWKGARKPKARPREAPKDVAPKDVAPKETIPKPVNGIGSNGAITDALIYLRHAEKEIMDMVRDGKISRPDQAHLLTLLALGAIQKSIGK